MANLVVSADCNQTCPYCFAADCLATTAVEERHLSLDDLASRLSFLERSGIDQIRLIGGEPSQHPAFTELLGMVERTGKDVMLFTNGLMSDNALQALLALPKERLTVLVNVNQPDAVATHVHSRRLRTLALLGERAFPGFTIYRPDFDPSFLLEVVAETGCKRVIRLGLAHPCLSGGNAHIHPGQYAFVGQKIGAFARAARRNEVALSLDCGFVPCMFSEDDLDTLRGFGKDVGWHCNPVLDMLMDGRVVPCFPLAERFCLDVEAGVGARDIRQRFQDLLSPYRQAGVFAACSTCPAKASGECPGGCLAVTMRRFFPVHFRGRHQLEESYRGEGKDTPPGGGARLRPQAVGRGGVARAADHGRSGPGE